MRMQIAPLPPITVGEYTDHPFILILDEVTDEQLNTLSDEAVGHHLKASTGARAVLVLTHTLDVHAALDLNTDEMNRLEAILDRSLNTQAGDPPPPLPISTAGDLLIPSCTGSGVPGLSFLPEAWLRAGADAVASF